MHRWQKALQRVDEKRMLYLGGNQEESETFAVKHFIEMAATAIEEHGAFYVALSGGSTPCTLYRELSKAPYLTAIDWEKVHLFWSDERCVPPEHSDSNYGTAMQAGLQVLPIPREHIHRMRGEENPELAAKDYESEITTLVPNASFDLIMLGMGKDGHTASLFPHSKALEVTDRLVVANEVNAKERWRLTLTFPCIQRAKQAVFYILGKAKAPMLKRVLYEEKEDPPLPAQLIGNTSRPALWIVDQEAASECPIMNRNS